jgi:hypothetical protein
VAAVADIREEDVVRRVADTTVDKVDGLIELVQVPNLELHPLPGRVCSVSVFVEQFYFSDYLPQYAVVDPHQPY